MAAESPGTHKLEASLEHGNRLLAQDSPSLAFWDYYPQVERCTLMLVVPVYLAPELITHLSAA